MNAYIHISPAIYAPQTWKNFKNDGNQNIILTEKANFFLDFDNLTSFFATLHRFCSITTATSCQDADFSRYDIYIHTYIVHSQYVRIINHGHSHFFQDKHCVQTDIMKKLSCRALPPFISLTCECIFVSIHSSDTSIIHPNLILEPV